MAVIITIITAFLLVGCMLACVWSVCRAAALGDEISDNLNVRRAAMQDDTDNDTDITNTDDNNQPEDKEPHMNLISNEARDIYRAETAGNLDTTPAYTGHDLREAYKNGATRTPTAVEIDAAARYLYNIRHEEPWDKAPESVHGEYRAIARKTVTVMREMAEAAR